MRFRLFSVCFFLTLSGFGQSVIRGVVRDVQEDRGLANATVQIFELRDSVPFRAVISRQGGRFRLPAIPLGNYRMRVSSVGYEPFDSLIVVSDTVFNMGTLNLRKSANLLDEVVVRAATPPVKQKNDTLEYSANAFKVNPDANAEDLVKKMPGITVENGTVKAGGEEVRKVTVDGREFFGEDATAALRNLPSEVIDKIQVFDRLSDQSQFTGFDDGTGVKAINIVTRANMRNGQFGRLYAGYGTEDRYSTGGNVTFLKGNMRISLVGMMNNVNQQNFANEDLLGLTSSNTRSNRSGGNRGGVGGNAGNFLVGQQGGITRTNSFGINFSDQFTPKWDIAGSYFFNNARNTSQEITERQLFSSGDSSWFYNELSNSVADNYNHRLSLRIEHKIDSFNSLVITPTLSYQKNNSVNGIEAWNSVFKTNILSSSNNSQDRSNSGYNAGTGLLYRHAFSKKGRTISIGINAGYNERAANNILNAFATGQNLNDSLRQYSDLSNYGNKFSGNIAYTEPVGKLGQLQLNYNPSVNITSNDQQTFQFNTGDEKYSQFDDNLSTRFRNRYSTRRGGVSYRIGDREKMFSVGLSYQQAELFTRYTFPYNSEIRRTFSNLLLNLTWRARLSATSNLRLNYNSSVSPPSVNQLQEIINNSNPLFLSTGNASLGQSLSHRVFARYNYTKSEKGINFFANLFFQKTDDYVGNASFIAGTDSVLSPSVILYKGSQLTKPVNLNGYYNARSFFTLGIPLRIIKSNLNINLGYVYTRAPGMINYWQNYSGTNTYATGVVISSNVSEFIDFTLSYSANFNNVRNTVRPNLNNDYFTQQAAVQFNLLSKSGWVLQNDLSNKLSKALTDGFNQHFWLWNVAVGKKFLKDKKGDIRLSVFDLLKQNRSIIRTVTETYLEDVQTQVLQQYFMLTFSYRLRNLGQPAKSSRTGRNPGYRN